MNKSKQNWLSGCLALFVATWYASSCHGEQTAPTKENPLCRIAVMSMASGYPMEVGQELVDDFLHWGFETELVPLFWENREFAAFDVDVLARLEHYGSFFFSGGDQTRIVQALVQDGEETPALRSIRRCRAAGGLVAGTSAGAAMMSGPMIVSGTSLSALSRGLCEDDADEDGFRLGRGLKGTSNLIFSTSTIFI